MVPLRLEARLLFPEMGKFRAVNEGSSLVSGESELSERESAIITLPDNQNAPYRVVSAGFRQSGFTLTQVKRAGSVAIYV
jgi:hypothetical protein